MQFYEIQNALLLNEYRKKELIEILSKLFVSIATVLYKVMIMQIQ